MADEKYGKNLVEMIVGLGCFESKCLNELKTWGGGKETF